MRRKEFPVGVIDLGNVDRDSSNRNIKDRKRVSFKENVVN